MKKLLAMIIALVLAASGLFAQTQAVIKQLSGKVEVKGPGATAWIPVNAGGFAGGSNRETPNVC